MFMSRNADLARAPVVLWLNGGPGCSSLYGALTQWGPSLVVGAPGVPLAPNPHTLITDATYIFLDQPIGTGFSSGPAELRTTLEAKFDVLRFLAEFFRYNFNFGGRQINFANNDFHIAGESYAGHYIPNIAASILQNNKRTDPGAPARINLKSVMIGNPAVDRKTENQVAFEYLCDPAKTPNPAFLIQDPHERENVCKNLWADDLRDCAEEIDECRKDPSRVKCQNAARVCGLNLVGPGRYAGYVGRDMYDLSNLLGPGQARNPVEGLNGNGFLAEPNIRVLIYTGDLDLAVPYLATKRNLQAINWDGASTFNSKLGNKERTYRQLSLRRDVTSIYGDYVRHSRLTYARIRNAGHMPNEKMPEQSKDLITRWLFYYEDSFKA